MDLTLCAFFDSWNFTGYLYQLASCKANLQHQLVLQSDCNFLFSSTRYNLISLFDSHNKLVGVDAKRKVKHRQLQRRALLVDLLLCWLGINPFDLCCLDLLRHPKTRHFRRQGQIRDEYQWSVLDSRFSWFWNQLLGKVNVWNTWILILILIKIKDDAAFSDFALQCCPIPTSHKHK